MQRSPSLKMMLCGFLQKFPSILILENNILSYSLTKAVFHLFPCCAVLCVAAQSCPTLCHLMDCSPLVSSVQGILQARILEWVAMPSSSGSSQTRDWTRSPALQADSLLPEPPGKPENRGVGSLPDPGIKLGSSALQADSLSASYQGICYLNCSYNECQIIIWRIRSTAGVECCIS